MPMTDIKAERMMRWMRENSVPFFSNSIEQNLLVIRYADLANDGMKQLFDRKRYSPYRNFVRSDAEFCDHVVYFLILESHEKIEEIYRNLMEQPWIGEYRVVKDISDYVGYSFLKVYDEGCSREAMLHELEKIMGTKNTVTFGGEKDRYDVYIENADRNLLVKELKRRCEPVDFRCWKSVFR